MTIQEKRRLINVCILGLSEFDGYGMGEEMTERHAIRLVDDYLKIDGWGKIIDKYHDACVDFLVREKYGVKPYAWLKDNYLPPPGVSWEQAEELDFDKRVFGHLHDNFAVPTPKK